MPYTSIPDSDIDADSPLTTSLLTALRDNGTIIQRVDATPVTAYAAHTSFTAVAYSDDPHTSSEGVEIITVSITPTNASNKLVIVFSPPVADIATSTARLVTSLFQDSTTNALYSTMDYGFSEAQPTARSGIMYAMTAGTTSATTFKVRMGTDTGSFYVNGDQSGRLYGGGLGMQLSVTEYP